MTAGPYTQITGELTNMQAFSDAINASGGTLVTEFCCNGTLVAVVAGSPPTPTPTPQEGHPKAIDTRKKP